MKKLQKEIAKKDEHRMRHEQAMSRLRILKSTGRVDPMMTLATTSFPDPANELAISNLDDIKDKILDDFRGSKSSCNENVEYFRSMKRTTPVTVSPKKSKRKTKKRNKIKSY